MRIFPPREVCAREDVQGRCATGETAGVPSQYEGRAVAPDAAVEAAMAPALARVRDLQATPLGAVLETPLPRGSGTEESALANLFADAIREVAPGTDAAIGHASGPGGLRTDLPAGPATLGALYETFPFDNLVVRRTLTGAELRQVLTTQLRRPRWGGRAFGVSGLHVRLECRGGAFDVEVERANGRAMRDEDVLVVAMSDYLAASATSIAPAAGAPHAGEPDVQMIDAVAGGCARTAGGSPPRSSATHHDRAGRERRRPPRAVRPSSRPKHLAQLACIVSLTRGARGACRCGCRSQARPDFDGPQGRHGAPQRPETDTGFDAVAEACGGPTQVSATESGPRGEHQSAAVTKSTV